MHSLLQEFKGVQGEKAEEQNLNYLPHEPFSSIVSTMIGKLPIRNSISCGENIHQCE